MAVEQILINTGATLEITFSAGDADGDVTVTVTVADGTVLVDAEAATNETEAGRYTYQLDPVDELTVARLDWTGEWASVEQTITDYTEVVGGYLFLLGELRAFDDLQLADTTKYPDDVLRDARSRISEMFQQVCGVPFFPRYGTATVDGNGCEIVVPHRRITVLRSVTIDGTALSETERNAVEVYPSGILYRASGWSPGRRNVVLEFEYGHASTPWPVRREAMRLARYELVPNEISDRMLSMSNELGVVRISQPGTQYPTGVPAVDATLERFSEQVGFG